METTFAHEETNATTLQQFRADGYATHIIVIATPHQISAMSILTRYVKQCEEYDGAGRWTDPTIHDAAFRQVPNTLRALIDKGLVDTVDVKTRTGMLLTGYNPNTLNGLSVILDALNDGRDFAQVPPAMLRQWDRDKQIVRKFLSSHPNQQQVASRFEHITGEQIRER